MTKHQGGGYTLGVKLKRANLSKGRDAKLQGLKLTMSMAASYIEVRNI